MVRNFGKGREVMKVIVEVSARHMHPSKYTQGVKDFTKKRELTQPGHWVANEKITAHGMNFSIVMPPRDEEAFEMSITDWVTHTGTHPAFSGKFHIKLRHFHCDPKTAADLGIKEGDEVSIKVGGIRAGKLDKVLVRINDWAIPTVHLDTDEANALFLKSGDAVELIVGGY